MTHGRASVALIVVVSAAVLATDLAYAATRWSGAFRESYLVTVVGLAIAVAIGGILRLALPPSRGRRAQRVSNGILRLTIVGFVLAALRSDGSMAGEFLGIVAGLALTFLLLPAFSRRRVTPDTRE